MKVFASLLVICAIFILPGRARIPIPPSDEEVGDSVAVDSEADTTTEVDTSTVKFASFANQCCCNCKRPPIPIGRPRFQCKFVCPPETASTTTTPSTTTTTSPSTTAPEPYLDEDPLPKSKNANAIFFV